MKPDHHDYDVTTAEGLARYHSELDATANRIVQLLMKFGEEECLSLPMGVNAVYAAAAKLGAWMHAADLEHRHKPLPDEVHEAEILDFRLTFLKVLIEEFPELVSDKLKRETAYLGRETKRRRAMANAPDKGEA